MSFVYLQYQEIHNIHSVQLRLYGGMAGIRDLGLVLSAEQAPQQTAFGNDAYPTIFDKASVYAYNISETQPFVDGNKRTGIGCAFQFLLYNGYYIDKTHEIPIYNLVIQIANKFKTRADLSNYLSDHCYELDLP